MAGLPVPTTPGALVDADTFIKRFGELAKNTTPETIQGIIIEACASLEDMVDRRLAPFTGVIYEDRLFGSDPDEYGSSMLNVPMSAQGMMGMSYAQAVGATDLIRHFWLPEYAPRYPELWTYQITSMQLSLTYGNKQLITIPNGGLIGDSPSSTDGHCWLRLGTFAPEGSRIKVVYSGGYTKGIPPSLARAALYQTAKYLMLEIEPQQRSGLSLDEIDLQVTKLMAPWARP